MCLGALYGSRADGIYFAGTRHDAVAAGFDDERLYAALAAPLSERELPMTHLLGGEGRAPFADWAEQSDRIPY